MKCQQKSDITTGNIISLQKLPEYPRELAPKLLRERTSLRVDGNADDALSQIHSVMCGRPFQIYLSQFCCHSIYLEADDRSCYYLRSMDVSKEALVKKYAGMGDIELQEFARSYDSLAVYAREALRAESRLAETWNRSGSEMTDFSPASRDFVTVRRYRDLTEAMVARSVLESAGIPAYLRDENLVRMD